MQAEIIRGLQMAVQNPSVVLNLRLLHEATITNRKDTFVTLDELKQRLIMTRHLPRQLHDPSQHRASVMTVPFTRPNTFDLSNIVLEDNVPSAISSSAQKEMKQPKSSLARYLQTKRSSSTSNKPSASPPTERPSINYCQAFEEMVKTRGEDRATLLNDIDEISMLYKGLELGSGSLSPQSWSQNQHPPDFAQRRGTLDVLGGDTFSHLDPRMKNQNAFHTSESRLTPYPLSHESSTFNQNVSSGPTQQTMYPTPTRYEARPFHRSSDSSVSSTPYSDISRDRHDSESSHTSYGSSDPRYSLYPPPVSNGAFAAPSSPSPISLHHNDYHNTYLPYGVAEQNHTTSVAPLSPTNKQFLQTCPQINVAADSFSATVEAVTELNDSQADPQRSERVPNAIAPFASPSDSPIPIYEDRTEYSPKRPVILSSDANDPPSSHSSSSGHTVKKGNFATSWLRTTSAPVVGRIRQPSIASTDSSGSGSFGILPRPVGTIPSSTVRSPKPGQERMINGRPCKNNNYWGFCKGSWDVREDIQKGLALRTMPSGMYNTKEVWECKSCNFRGNTYSIVHPTKKSRKETIVDPNIHVSKSGVRYRWIFLAKSHAKKKTPDSANEECNYGCVICSVELKVTSIFGNVDTLMYHLLEHTSDMTQMTMKQTKCVVGRTAGMDEDWDINIPLFADVSEVEG